MAIERPSRKIVKNNPSYKIKKLLVLLLKKGIITKEEIKDI